MNDVTVVRAKDIIQCQGINIYKIPKLGLA